MATLILISSFAAWITVLIKRDDIVTGCQQYLLGLNSNSSSYYSPVNLPNGTISLHKEDCVSATKHLLIIGGIAVFLGNFVQVTFFFFSIYYIGLMFAITRFISHLLLMLMLPD